MPDDLYYRDALVWSERQAELLRRLASGELVNDAVDWTNVIEEVQDVGLSELRSCENFLRQVLIHLLKIRAWPNGPVDHWQAETINFLAEALSRYSPSMRGRIDLDRAWRRAVRQVRATRIDGVAASDIPFDCRVTLDDLLAEDADVMSLAAGLS